MRLNTRTYFQALSEFNRIGEQIPVILLILMKRGSPNSTAESPDLGELAPFEPVLNLSRESDILVGGDRTAPNDAPLSLIQLGQAADSN